MSNRMDKGQQSAIKVNKGPVLVLAGPGSGKTTVITHRLKYLVKTLKINPNKILVVTFTNAAAQEMKERAITLCGDKIKEVDFGTFHAISLMILREEKGVHDGDIMPENERRAIVSKLCKSHFPEEEDKTKFFKNALSDLSLAQGCKGGVDNFVPHICDIDKFKPFFIEYIDTIRNTGRLTFDDMLYDCVELLENNSEVLKKWQEKWEYILVDEYQDSNPIQERELELLAYPENNIMVVGDDDQSIYGFRGANSEVMLNFPKQFKNTKIVHLSMNYRSNEEIVNHSDILIKNNKNRYEKKPESVKGKGGQVVIKRESNSDTQIKTIINSVKNFNDNGIPYSEMAIICRTNNETAPFVQAFLKNEIPFVVKESVENIFEHWIAKDILSYIEMANIGITESTLSRIVNRPKRYVERETYNTVNPFTISNLKKYYDEQYKVYIVDALNKLENDIIILKDLLSKNPFDAITYILDNIGYKKFLETRASETKCEIAELYVIVDEILNSTANYNNIEEWLQYIQEYTEQLKNKSFGNKNDSVSIMTMHSAKGLEFEAVFVPNLIEGQVPYVKAKTINEIEEERRMLYVAMTRAKSKLFLLVPRMIHGKETKQSRFVKEIKDGMERIQLDIARQMILETAQKNKGKEIVAEIKESEQNKQKKEIITPKDIKKDAIIQHKDFGKGYVQEKNETTKKMIVFFENFGKTFVIDEMFCIENDLLSFPTKKKGKKDV